MAKKETLAELIAILRDPRNFARVHKKIVSSVITADTNLHEDLGFKRIEDYEFVTCIGYELDINIPDGKIEEFRTVKEYENYIERTSPDKRKVS